MTNTRQSNFQLAPGSTPPFIRKLLILTAVIAIGSSFLEKFFHYFGVPGPEKLLALSMWGMKNFLIYQPISYLFVLSSFNGGITFGWIISLGFTLYLIWVFGSSVFEWIGRRSFMILYFGSGALAGLLGLLFLGPYASLSGATPALMAVLTVWTMMHPEAMIFLFLLIPLKAKHLFAILLGAVLLINISQWDLPQMLFYLAGPIYGYIYGRVAWGFSAPFEWMRTIDAKLDRIETYYKKKTKAEIFTFKREDELDDEAFVDAMLKKISQKGQNALTPQEKKRLDEISLKKKH